MKFGCKVLFDLCFSNELGTESINFIIRQEQESEYASTEKIVEIAFASAVQYDQNENKMVSRIRQIDSFIPEVSN